MVQQKRSEEMGSGNLLKTCCKQQKTINNISMPILCYFIYCQRNPCGPFPFLSNDLLGSRRPIQTALSLRPSVTMYVSMCACLYVFNSYPLNDHCYSEQTKRCPRVSSLKDLGRTDMWTEGQKTLLDA